MKYQILTKKTFKLSYALEWLQRKVREDIKNGWEPLGGVSIAFDEDDKQYVVAQAMIKKEERKLKKKGCKTFLFLIK